MTGWQVLYNKENEKNLWLVSPCPFTYLPATSKHWIVMNLGQSLVSLFHHPCPNSIMFIMGHWQIVMLNRKDNRWIWKLGCGPRFLHTLAAWPGEVFFIPLIPGFLICSQGKNNLPHTLYKMQSAWQMPFLFFLSLFWPQFLHLSNRDNDIYLTRLLMALGESPLHITGSRITAHPRSIGSSTYWNIYFQCDILSVLLNFTLRELAVPLGS